MRRQKSTRKNLIIENDAVQTENAKGNVEVFLIVMTLFRPVETQLIKVLRLPLVLLKLPQTKLTTLRNKRSIKSFPKLEQKWKGCFPK